MAFLKQIKYKAGKKLTEAEEEERKQAKALLRKQTKDSDSNLIKYGEDSDRPSGLPLGSKFLDYWHATRQRHTGPSEVLKAVFEEKCQYVFYRAGRKGAKTTTAIDIAWRLAMEQPNRVGYLCYPTIAQGIEVVWEERRLQTFDKKDDSMFDRYVEKVDDNKHIVRFSNGSFVKLIGTWTEARGRGTQPDFLIFDEFQDANPDYIEAMDANLAAKPHAQCIMMGTPPKKRNHYEEWLDRVGSHPRGKIFHYTSYDNVNLPHLKEWLDNKKLELTKAGKEDVWLREYMAELCYASSDRVLPDAKFEEKEAIDLKARLFAHGERVPVLAVSVHPTYFCCVLAVLIPKKMIFVMDHLVFPQIWNQAYSFMYPELKEKVKILQDFCGKKIRNVVWDESDSFIDVISGFTKCRKDLKWQDRGIPLLREMMLKEKIVISREVADFGLECQNLLQEESDKDVQKNYPHVCTLSMMVNEYFSQEKFAIHSPGPFDPYDALRSAGIPCTPKKKVNNILRFMS